MRTQRVDYGIETARADIQVPAGNGAPSPGTDAGLPQPDLVAAIPRLRRYARVLTGDITRADDLVQDTLVRAWDKRRLWKTGSDLRAWLFTVMHNVYVNQRMLARREVRNISLECDGEDGPAWQVAVHGNQLDRVALRELAQQVGRLPVEQREVLLLAAVEELRYEEIAGALAIPIGTVMSRLSRAREKLRRMAIEPVAAPEVTRDRHSRLNGPFGAEAKLGISDPSGGHR